jgi:hypothetical protein
MKRSFTITSIHHPRGALLVEGVVACLILGVAIGMLVPALAAIGRQRQAMRFDALAMIELNNISALVRASAVPVAEIGISDWFSDRYSDAHLKAESLPEIDDTTSSSMEAIRFSIRRPRGESVPDQTVSIVVWRSKGVPAP